MVPERVDGGWVVRACASLLAVALLLESGGARAADGADRTPSNAGRCAALQRAAAEPATIVKTELIPAGSVLGVPPGMPMAAPLALPEHCFVQGTLESRTGAGGRPFHIGYELRLPIAWNGRFLFQGGAGLDGIVTPAVGRVGVSATPALARGFAVVSNDSGHQGQDASFGFDQQARLNFGYAAIGKVTAEAKRIIARFYGRGADHSYFIGCSNGGREAMMAADRYPDQFDGIVAGDPGFRLSAAAIAQLWDTRHFASVAPRDASGRPILSQSFSPAELSLVAKAVVQQCDALDGLADGMINNLTACHFNVAKLSCRAGQSSECLSAAKVRVLDAVFKGAHDSRGHALYSSWPYDGGIGDSALACVEARQLADGRAQCDQCHHGPERVAGVFPDPAAQEFQPRAVRLRSRRLAHRADRGDQRCHLDLSVELHRTRGTIVDLSGRQ